MKLTMTALAFGLILAGQSAFALTPNEAVSALSADGYSRIEVRVGPTQMKVEAIRGNEKLEVIYDRATGAVLKTEVEMVDAGENTAPGVSIRERNRDFVRVRTGGVSGGEIGDDNGGDRGGRGRGSDDDHDDDHDDDRGDDRDDDRGDDRDDDRGDDRDDDNDDDSDDDSDDDNDDDGDDDSDDDGDDNGSDDD